MTSTTTEGNLLRTLVHELRNHVAPVVNAAHLMRLRAGADAELAPILAIIERQLAGMTRTLDDIVDADRLLRGEVTLQTRRIDLVGAVETALQGKRAAIEGRGQHLHFAPPPDPVWIEADPARLAQALGNVLENATRYTPEGGDISVEVDSGESKAEVRITDNGSGIAPDALPLVFAAYAARGLARGGSGVGLAVARKLCEMHHGRIVARSAGEGRGSSFAISIPLAPESESRAQRAAAGAAPAATAPLGPGSRRILVADDNQAMRNSFAAILRELGHDVRLATDGMQALQLAEEWKPEFVILDVHMPRINGYEVARKLRSRFPPGAMRLVMMSGTDLEQTTLQAAREAGFDHCIDKTLAVRGLEALLRGETPPLAA